MLGKKSEDTEYMGNIWGWKISFMSLGLILFMLALMGIRYCQLQHMSDQPAPNLEQVDE